MVLYDMDILIAVATGLGKREEDASGSEYYLKDPECLENLKDLQRFMRRDNPESRDVFMQLGQWNIVRRDLVPIITTYRSNYELVLAAVKVIVFLTMPPVPESDNVSRQQEYLQRFKAAFLEDEALGVIVAMMEEPLGHLESDEFTDDDARLVQLFLTLFRNLLAISDPSAQQTTASGGAHLAYMKEELLERLFRESVMDLLLALAPHVSRDGRKGPLRNDNLLLLEIFYFTFKDQRPLDLLTAVDERDSGKASKTASAAALEMQQLVAEEQRKRAQLLMNGPPRHSFFAGTYTRKWKDGAPSIVRTNPFVSDFDRLASKSSVRSARMKPVAAREGTVHLSAQVRGMLKEHADQFLEGGYNVLMKTVKDDIRRESPRATPMDAVMFFKVAGFFTAYQKERLQAAKSAKTTAQRAASKTTPEKSEKEMKAADEVFAAAVRGCGEIAATMDEEMFNMVVARWREYAETIKEGKEFTALAAAGALLKDMIHILDLILKTADARTEAGKRERSVAHILLLKVFYDQTDTGILSFLVRLMKAYDSTKQPKADMGTLVEMAHTILRMLEEYSKANGEIRVLKKVRKVRRRKKLPVIEPEQLVDETELPGEETEQPVEEMERPVDADEWPGDGDGGLDAAELEKEEGPGEEGEQPGEGMQAELGDAEGCVDGTEGLEAETEPVERGDLDGETERVAEDTERMPDEAPDSNAIGDDTEVPLGETSTEPVAVEEENGGPLRDSSGPLAEHEPAENPEDGADAAEKDEAAAETERAGAVGDHAAENETQRSPERRDGLVESDPEDSSAPGHGNSFGQRPDSGPEESGVVRFDAPEGSDVIRFDAGEESGVIRFDGPENSGAVSQAGARARAAAGADEVASAGVQDEYEEYEEEEEEDNTREVVLDAKACAFLFADNTVVRNLVWMLEGYRGNSVQVNYYIGRMLDRIAKDCELEPMLYQLAFFGTFYKVVSDVSFCRAKENALLADVLTRTVRHFMATAAEQPLVFMELLFWKTARECHLISQRYKEEPKHKGRRGRAPTGLGGDGDGACGPFDAQADEQLKELFERFKHEKGCKDLIYEALDGEFRKSHIAKRLKQLGLTGTRGRKQTPFTEEQDERIKQLFDKYKTNRSCAALIAGDLEGGFTRAQVARRLKQLDLSRPKKGAFDALIDSSSDDSSDDDSEREPMHFEKNERGDEELPDGDFGAPPSETWEADRAVGEADEKEVTQRVHQLMKYGTLEEGDAVEWVVAKIDRVLADWKGDPSGAPAADVTADGAPRQSATENDSGDVSKEGDGRHARGEGAQEGGGKEGGSAAGAKSDVTADVVGSGSGSGAEGEDGKRDDEPLESGGDQAVPMEVEGGESAAPVEVRAEEAGEMEGVVLGGDQPTSEEGGEKPMEAEASAGTGVNAPEKNQNDAGGGHETPKQQEGGAGEAPQASADKEASDVQPRSDFTIIPMTELDWACLENRYVKRLLTSLCFKYPRHGAAYWKVPGNCGWGWLEQVRGWVSEARANVPEEVEDAPAPEPVARPGGRRARIDWSDDDDGDVIGRPRAVPAEDGLEGEGFGGPPKRRRLVKKGEESEGEEARVRAKAEARLAKEKRKEEKRLEKARRRAELEREGGGSARARAPRKERKGPVKKRVRREVPELEPDSDVDMDDIQAFLSKEAEGRRVREEENRVKEELAEKERQERIARGEEVEEVPPGGKKKGGRKGGGAKKATPRKRASPKRKAPAKKKGITPDFVIDENVSDSESVRGEASMKEERQKESPTESDGAAETAKGRKRKGGAARKAPAKKTARGRATKKHEKDEDSDAENGDSDAEANASDAEKSDSGAEVDRSDAEEDRLDAKEERSDAGDAASDGESDAVSEEVVPKKKAPKPRGKAGGKAGAAPKRKATPKRKAAPKRKDAPKRKAATDKAAPKSGDDDVSDGPGSGSDGDGHVSPIRKGARAEKSNLAKGKKKARVGAETDDVPAKADSGDDVSKEERGSGSSSSDSSSSSGSESESGSGSGSDSGSSSESGSGSGSGSDSDSSSSSSDSEADATRPGKKAGAPAKSRGPVAADDAGETGPGKKAGAAAKPGGPAGAAGAQREPAKKAKGKEAAVQVRKRKDRSDSESGSSSSSGSSDGSSSSSESDGSARKTGPRRKGAKAGKKRGPVEKRAKDSERDNEGESSGSSGEESEDTRPPKKAVRGGKTKGSVKRKAKRNVSSGSESGSSSSGEESEDARPSKMAGKAGKKKGPVKRKAKRSDVSGSDESGSEGQVKAEKGVKANGKKRGKRAKK